MDALHLKLDYTTKYVFIMVGLPGSDIGLSAAYLAKRYNLNLLSFSDAMIRTYGSTDVHDNNDKALNSLIVAASEALLLNDNIVINAYNVNVKARRKLISRLSHHGCKFIAYVVNTPVEICKERVSQESLYAYLNRFQFPQRFEGFENIIIDSCFENRTDFDAKYRKYIEFELDSFDQHNPHHIHTVGGHSRKMSSLLLNDVEKEAALLHDIGKLATQSFDENGIAHYFAHENIGVYQLISNPSLINLSNPKDVEYLLFLVNYHMKCHTELQRDKTANKYKSLFGKEWFDNLMSFGEADRNSMLK
jgi:predicted kinase